MSDQSGSGSEQQWRDRLREADGEKVIRYDDDHGHQFLIWRDGEIVRLTHPNFADDGRYHGPYGTTDDLFASLVEDGEMELVDRSETPFATDDGLRADGGIELGPICDECGEVLDVEEEWALRDGLDTGEPAEDGDYVHARCKEGGNERECPCCRDETFEHRDYLIDHLQQYHSAAEVYVEVVE